MLGYRQLLFNRYTDYNACASFTAEKSLLDHNSQPAIWIPGLDFTQVGRQFRLSGRGVLSSTGTPTYLFKVRAGVAMTGDNQTSFTNTTVIGTTAALTTGSGVSNTLWDFWLEFALVTPGIGSGAVTITSGGVLVSSGLATPVNDLSPTNGSATWTTTPADSSADLFFLVTATCSASSSSNTLTLKQLTLEALN